MAVPASKWQVRSESWIHLNSRLTWLPSVIAAWFGGIRAREIRGACALPAHCYHGGRLERRRRNHQTIATKPCGTHLPFKIVAFPGVEIRTKHKPSLPMYLKSYQ